MSENLGSHGSPYKDFTGPNLGYVMEMYELFKSSPELVDAELAEMFRKFGAPVEDAVEKSSSVSNVPEGNIGKIISALKLQEAIRTYGHLAADIYPLNDHPKDSSRLELSYYDLSENDLEEMPASLILNKVPAHIENGLEAINYLKSLYSPYIRWC